MGIHETHLAKPWASFKLTNLLPNENHVVIVLSQAARSRGRKKIKLTKKKTNPGE
jgi:hypothetical protein